MSVLQGTDKDIPTYKYTHITKMHLNCLQPIIILSHINILTWLFGSPSKLHICGTILLSVKVCAPELKTKAVFYCWWEQRKERSHSAHLMPSSPSPGPYHRLTSRLSLPIFPFSFPSGSKIMHWGTPSAQSSKAWHLLHDRRHLLTEVSSPWLSGLSPIWPQTLRPCQSSSLSQACFPHCLCISALLFYHVIVPVFPNSESSTKLKVPWRSLLSSPPVHSSRYNWHAVNLMTAEWKDW